MKERIIQALKDALVLMNGSGAHWTQFQLRRVVGTEQSFCSLGAIYQVTGADIGAIVRAAIKAGPDEQVAALSAGDPVLRLEVIRSVVDALPEDAIRYEGDAFPALETAITTYNDARSRTWADIVLLFERAQAQVAARS